MDRKSLLKDFSYKLRKIRESLNYSHREMAAYFGTEKTNYTRYETGRIFPGFMGLYNFANISGVSLDWLICDRGPMYYKKEEEKDDSEISEAEKVIEEKAGDNSKPAVKIPDGETRELLDYMEQIPLLRHEVMVSFYKFKEEHKEMVQAAEANMEAS
jgi:transcriptional regulator with XRE-family HTH domain